MGNDSTTAFRTREQLREFVGIFSPRFKNRRWKMEVLGQVLFGIQAAKVPRKMFEVPEFFCYATADGLRWPFMCHGKWRGLDCPRERAGDFQMEFECLTG